MNVRIMNRKITSDNNNADLVDDEDVRSTDILSGRGKTVFHHDGNKNYRELVAMQLGTYESSSVRAEKSVLVNAIVDTLLLDGARFLKRVERNRWRLMDKQEARNKVAHSVRDLLAEKVKCMTKSIRETCQYDTDVLVTPKAAKIVRRESDVHSSHFAVRGERKKESMNKSLGEERKEKVVSVFPTSAPYKKGNDNVVGCDLLHWPCHTETDHSPRNVNSDEPNVFDIFNEIPLDELEKYLWN